MADAEERFGMTSEEKAWREAWNDAFQGYRDIQSKLWGYRILTLILAAAVIWGYIKYVASP
jgi:hypothetical protein